MEKSRFLRTLLLAVVIVGGIWALVHRDQIRGPEDAFALLSSQISNMFPASSGGPVYPQPNIESQNFNQSLVGLSLIHI